jgi:ribonucleoside-diphosphate reductase alpha chain
VPGLVPLRVAVAGGSGAALPTARLGFVNQADAPSCSVCGAIMVRNGACYKCTNCGGTSGCS